MLNNNPMLRVNLQLFAEGVAEGTGETGAVAASQTGENPAQGTQPSSEAELTITEEQFKQLMNGQFKGVVNKHTEGIVKNRLKGTKAQLARYEALNPSLELLAQRYGTTTDNPEFANILNKAIEDDDAFFAEEAEKRGVSVDTMRQISKMERDNAAMQRMIAEQESQRRADEILKGWIDDAEKLKEVYPSFDLQQELDNPNFVELMKLPIFNLQSAYEFIHKDELDAAKSQVVAQQMEQKIANKVASNQRLPVENGVAATSAATAQRDVRSLTRADRERINLEIAAGKKYTFG